MSFTYDVTTDIGKVRLKIADVDLTTTVGDRKDWTCLFTDEEIQIFLDESSSDVNGACYYAWVSIASSRAHLAKMKKLGDYQEDLTKLAEIALSMADKYKSASIGADFGYAEQSVSDFAYRDIVWRASL